MASETVENYIKAVHTLAAESPTQEAAMSRIAALVGVTTGTATSMVKKLASGGFAKYKRFGGVTLTAKGHRVALDILRRHRLIETFLVQTLKLDWSVVHAEAERLEHAVSPAVVDALDALLGHPSVDPHGDPIPDRNGRLRSDKTRPLTDCRAGETVRLARVTDQAGVFLEFAALHGLKPGASITVLASDTQAQAILVQSKGFVPVSLAHGAAAKVAVSAIPFVNRHKTITRPASSA